MQLSVPTEKSTHTLVPTGTYTIQQESDDAGVLVSFLLLWRRKWLFLSIVLLALIIVGAISARQTPTYSAVASLEFQGFNENYLNLRSITATDPMLGAAAFDTYIQTQVEILRDRSLIEKVVKKLSLDEDPKFTRESPSVLNRLTGRQTSVASPLERAVLVAGESLGVRATGSTRIIKVSFDSPDPQLAARFVNTLVDTFIQDNLESRWQSTQKTGEWLQAQLLSLRQRLRDAETELQGYAKDTGLLFTAEKNSVAEEKLRQLQTELSAAQADRMSKQSQYEMAVGATPESLPQVVRNATARDYQTRLADLRRELVEMSALLTPNHYKVQRAQAQIAEMERALSRELANTVTSVKNEYLSATNREKMLVEAYNRQVGLIMQKAPAAAHYNMLKREVDTQRAFHEAMAQQVQEAGVASAIRASNIRVIGRAVPPSTPYKPNFMLNVALALFTGSILGFGVVLISSKVDQTYRRPGDVTAHLSVSELGAIPSAPRSSSCSLFQNPVACLTDPEGVVAESFRATIASMLALGEHRGKRILLVTSPGPQEGKTTVISSLSVELARGGKKVLLIDGDLRQPRLSGMHDAHDDAGLQDLMSADSLSYELLKRHIRPTATPGIDILPSGRRSSSVPQLMEGNHLAEIMRLVRAQYDFVLVDTPPALAVADARFLSRFTDAVVMVLRAGQTRREEAVAVLGRMQADRIPVLGVVLNDWDARRHGTSSYNAYKAYVGGNG